MFDPDAIAEEVLGRVRRHTRLVQTALYAPPALPALPDNDGPAPLRSDIERLVVIANGAVDRRLADVDSVADVLELVQRVLDILFAQAYETTLPRIPASFWASPGIGQVLAHVQAWLRHDDLISYTQAAQLLFPSLAQQNVQAARMRIKRLTEGGTLMLYRDPSTPNPTQQVRVSRQAVEALRAVQRS
jgi:hypothetical protein